ncbi:MAG: methylamine utilization protein MauE [Congregibacter sp.]|nr:methylamine utilization protein MauE [Congregibacter sp.]
MIDPLLQLTLALSLFLLFVSASQHKRGAARRFVAQLDAYELLPKNLSPIAAAVLPWLELAIGVSLLVPASRSTAAWVAMFVLVLYALAVLINLLRGRRDIDCGCGDTAQPLSYWLVLRNAVLAVSALVITLPVAERALHVADAAAMIFMSALLALCYLTVSQLLHNQGAQSGWSSHEH